MWTSLVRIIGMALFHLGETGIKWLLANGVHHPNISCLGNWAFKNSSLRSIGISTSFRSLDINTYGRLSGQYSRHALPLMGFCSSATEHGPILPSRIRQLARAARDLVHNYQFSHWQLFGTFCVSSATLFGAGTAFWSAVHCCVARATWVSQLTRSASVLGFQFCHDPLLLLLISDLLEDTGVDHPLPGFIFWVDLMTPAWHGRMALRQCRPPLAVWAKNSKQGLLTQPMAPPRSIQSGTRAKQRTALTYCDIHNGHQALWTPKADHFWLWCAQLVAQTCEWQIWTTGLNS